MSCGLCACLLAAFAFHGPGHESPRPASVYVDPAGNDTTGDGSAAFPFRTPQRGVDVVDVGGQVWLRPGNYPFRTTVSKTLRLSATVAGQAMLGPSSLPGAVLSVVGADDVVVEGVVFVGSPTTRGLHANSGADRVVIDACDFAGFGTGGVLVDGPASSGHEVRRCRFRDLRGIGASAAVALHGAGGARVHDCSFATCDRGVDLVGANDAVLTELTFADLFQAAIVASGATDVVIEGARLTRCGHFATPRTWSTPSDARGAISLVAFSHRARVRRTLVEHCGGYTGKNTFVGSELFRYDGLFGIGVADSDDVVIEDCALHRNAFGGVHVTGATSGLVLRRCNLVHNGERNDPGKDTALYTGGAAVVATDNFWGLPTGPNHDGAGAGNGIDGGGSVSLAPLALRPFAAPRHGFDPLPDVAVGTRPLGVVLADFDGDGRLDVAVCEDQDGAVSVARNLGGGVFAPRTTTVVGGRPVALASGHLDAGATVDLVVLDEVGDRAVILRGNGDGTFVAAASVPLARRPQRLRVADLDGVQGDDVVVACEGDVFFPGALQVLRNDGTGGFVRATLAGAAQPTDVEVIDLNADLRPDVVAFDREASAPGLRQYTNLGAGAFAGVVRTPVDAHPVLAATLQRTNVDGGADDLLVASYRFDVPPGTTTLRLFRGTGAGSLAAPIDLRTTTGPVVVRAAAFTAPGEQGVVLVNPGFATVEVLGPVQGSPAPFAPYATSVLQAQYVADAAVGDVTEDGQPDLLLADGGANRVVVLRSAGSHEFTTYGSGCLGSAGVPAVRWHSLPQIGAATFTLAVEHGVANALSVAMLGAVPLNAPLPGGCFLYVDPLIQLFTVTDVDGFAAINLPIPAETRLLGLTLFGQWFVVDTGGLLLGLLSASEGFRFVVGG
ncbi:MAG: FG-GAP-like repeat-containing protein [Planctomycetota bacterium]